MLRCRAQLYSFTADKYTIFLPNQGSDLSFYLIPIDRLVMGKSNN